ncbi:MAG: WYL domain-containing protein [Gemmatimonadales bacterium]|nr:WYL domain-containing protein [Gemmatimonadales bacterium]
MTHQSPKIQRWIDLLATLLTHRFPVTLEEIVRGVPAYHAGSQKKETLRRMFERDKDELRRFGVLIETVPLPEGEADGYRLLSRDFYLPYLSLMVDGRPSKPRKLDKYGYASLPSLSFEPDELEAVGQAAARVGELGDPLLAEHAESAIRKLAVDLPLDAARAPDLHIAPARSQPDAEVFPLLGAALQDRKRVSFDYRSMGADLASRRTVEPYGLFFLNQHWYLAGRAPGEEIVKNYRLSRIGTPEVNKAQPGTRDYEIPAGFRLAQHAGSKQAWELGDGDTVDAVVEFRRAGGAAAAAARLGETIPDYPERRRFRVRRRDAFARWLLSFAGEVVPLSPAELVSEYDALVSATLSVYLLAEQ